MIKAKVVKQSRHFETGKLITTFEVEMHRYILSENNTHNMVTKNSASSRAVPILANIEYIKNNTAFPVHWGKNQSGMVAEAELPKEVQEQAKQIWENARDDAIKHATALAELGVHKQLTNRLIENFSYQKAILTATEWDNFFWLRADKDAQPEIRELAEKMMQAYNHAQADILFEGEWHLPYIDTMRNDKGDLEYFSNGAKLTLEEAQKISASCCAQVSYRKADDSLDKAIKVFNMLNIDNPDENSRPHSSPTAHQATPIVYGTNWDNLMLKLKLFFGKGLPKGITHMKSDGSLWSANFKDFIQYRHLIPNESKQKHPNLKD